MRELLLLDLAGFRCGVRKEDILSHEEQIIHWLTDNNGAVTAIAMMGAHPVSLADLSYCIGRTPASRRAGRYPVLVPADHDLSVSFVAEQEAGIVQVPCSAVYPLPAYLQTPFIDSCVQLDGKFAGKFDGKLVPLINIRAVHCRISAGEYTPPTPQCCLPGLKENRKKRTPSLDVLRVFTCKKKSFAASATYFSSKQALSPGVLTRLPLMPEFVRGITLHNNQVLTVLDIRRYLQLSSASEDEEEKWLIGEVEGQGFAFVVTADQGLLPADAASLAALPLLVRSDWQQNVVLHDRKIIPVLDFRELFTKHPDEIRSRTVPCDVQSDGRFKAVFGKQQVEIVEFSLCTMVHALPDLEVADIIPFRHCQRLTGTKGLIVGVTLYKKELLPLIDPARCFGRKSRPAAGWKLLLVCNGDLRVLVLVEEVLGKRSLNMSEQRALPFTAPHSSVYGCYPVAGRVGLIFNIMALTAYFDDKQISELFFFADDLLPPVNDIGKSIEEQGTEVFLESDREIHDDWGLEAKAPVLLTEEQDTLVQSVAAAMLNRKGDDLKSEAGALTQDEAAASALSKGIPESEEFCASRSVEKSSSREVECPAEDGREEDTCENKTSNAADRPLDASPVLLTDEQDNLITSALASMVPGGKEGEEEKEEREKGGSEIHEEQAAEQRAEQELGTVADTLQHVTEPPAEVQEVLGLLSLSDDVLQEDNEQQAAAQSANDKEDVSPCFVDTDFEEKNRSGQADTGPDADSVLLTREQENLLQSALISAFHNQFQKKDQENVVIPDIPDRSERTAEPEDVPVIMFTEEQDALLQSPPAAAFSQEEDGEYRAGKSDERAPLPPPKVPEEDRAVDAPAPVEPDTWNVLEDADTFPELKDFVRRVSGTQQAASPLALPHADFVKNLNFPLLFSPDSRKIKEQLDKKREKERDIFFRKAADELEKRPDIQAKEESRNRLKLWMCLLLPCLFSGFLLWLFVFRNQEVFREKNIKSGSQLSEINAEASPMMQDAVPEQREESKPAQQVVHTPVLSQSEAALKGRETLEQEVPEAPADQPVQTTSEPIPTDGVVEELPENIGRGTESVPENDEKQQAKIPYREQDQGQGEEGLVGNIHESDQKSDALSQGYAAYAADDGAGDAEDDNIAADIVSDNSADVAAAVAPGSAMTAEKDSVEGLIGASSDDAENKGKEASAQQSVTAALRGKGKAPDKAGAAQVRNDEKREVRILEFSGDHRGTVKDSTTVRRRSEEKKQADGPSAEAVSVSTPLISGALTETDRADGEQKKTVEVEKIDVEITDVGTINVELMSNERTTPADQGKSPLMSPVNGTSDHTRHTVSKGDTLWEISEQYTGSGFNYPDVARKNKIANPDLIYPEQQVTLPAKK